MALKRLLVANRGEIALRIVRAARQLGIETVLAASQADRDSLAAQEADRIVVLGPAGAAQSYLNMKLLVHAALGCGCDALHPGYGFLSERAEFARLCAEHDICFVGPPASVIEDVGDKLSARKIAAVAGIPLVAGSAAVNDATEAEKIARDIGLPVVTKASAGGGGRGMAVIRDLQSLPSAFERASAEAREAFGDGTLFLEKYVENARHIEVQVMGDGDGNVVHFFERDCSIQRRYQKMVEEAPAVAVPLAVRAALRNAAVKLLESIRYRNAGTVEFLYDVQREEFSFMEINARIQVEHPVSEELTDVDLVVLQLSVAGDRALAVKQEDVQRQGHAIEVRLVAEDPDRNFAPSPGRITRWRPPTGRGIRLDTAVYEGASVTPFYDSMIGKLIVHAADRPTAIKRLGDALDTFVIEGIATNISLLRAIVQHPDFINNNVSTRWLENTFLPTYQNPRRS